MRRAFLVVDYDHLMLCDVIKSLTTSEHGKLVAGETVDLPKDAAERYARNGFVIVHKLPDPPAPKRKGR